MLLEFSVENHLSFKERVTFSFVASTDKTLSNNKFTANNKFEILKSAVIYGANAAGKSNLLKSIATLKRLVTTNHKRQKGDKLNVVPFKLDLNNVRKPTQFEVTFIHKDTKYFYGLAVDNEKVHEECLYFYPKGKQSIIFERYETNNYHFTKDVEVQLAISKRVMPNRLYLSSATEWNYSLTADAFEWFKNYLRTKLEPESGGWKDYTADQASKFPLMKQVVVGFLQQADTGIKDIDVKIKDVSDNDLSSFPPEIKKFLMKGKRVEVETFHEGIDENGQKLTVPFNFFEESKGTQKLFEIIGPWINVLQNGYLVLIDELETSLHPHLVEFLLDTFHDPKLNSENAQLLFSTHNTHLLNQNILRRDQIWFVEKDPDTGATDLFSLYDLGIRKDENIEKGYLLGRYGAVPFLNNDFSLKEI